MKCNHIYKVPFALVGNVFIGSGGEDVSVFGGDLI